LGKGQRKKHVQLALPTLDKNGQFRGGKRTNAGRKRAPGTKPRVAHIARPAVHTSIPQHVTVRMRPDAAGLRSFTIAPVLRRAFAAGCDKGRFRICQFSIQGNHIHLVVEAHDREALSRGMQGWSIRVARGLNRARGRSGKVFGDRYHANALRTSSQVRAALCYVLQNARKHGLALDRRWHGVDPFSSAWWFDGWREDRWRDGVGPPQERTVASARTWLLREGWRRRGLIDVRERPAAR